MGKGREKSNGKHIVLLNMSYESERDTKLAELLQEFPWIYDNIDDPVDYTKLYQDLLATYEENVAAEKISLIITARSSYQDLVSGYGDSEDS